MKLAAVRRFVFGAAVVLVASACSRPSPDSRQQDAPHVRAPLTASDESEVSKSPAAQELQDTRRDTPLPSAEEARRYVESVRKGRERTRAEAYDDAVVAYTTALAAIPTDARAHSGRGYAHLLAGRLNEAEVDLRAAIAAGPPSKLEAAVEFNLGMLEERRGNETEAERHFTRSWLLRPTKAARDRLQSSDASPCPGVDLTRRAPVHYAGWLDLWGAMNATLKENSEGASSAPTSDAEAKRSLCDDDGCSSAPPWVVVLRPNESDWSRHAVAVVNPASRGLWSTLPTAEDAECSANSAGASFTPHIERGRRWTITIDHGCDEYEFECEDEDTEKVLCEKNFHHVAWRTVLVFDPTTFEQQLALTTSGSANDWLGEDEPTFETRIELEANVLHIEGPCSAELKL